MGKGVLTLDQLWQSISDHFAPMEQPAEGWPRAVRKYTAVGRRVQLELSRVPPALVLCQQSVEGQQIAMIRFDRVISVLPRPGGGLEVEARTHGRLKIMLDEGGVLQVTSALF